MKFLIISGNPKTDGLCASVEAEVARGARDAGAEVEVLTVFDLPRCHVCGEGWGQCRETHECAYADDGFGAAQRRVREADAYCFITPVYWGEMAESLKSFFDRLRRCEFGQGAFAGKKVLLVASPGGSGNGAITCLDQMDRFCRHVGAGVFDYVSVNRWNVEYKRVSAYSAARQLIINN